MALLKTTHRSQMNNKRDYYSIPAGLEAASDMRRCKGTATHRLTNTITKISLNFSCSQVGKSQP
eukprot:m.20911 g.20911  ORF g.20911 m.20911 type:complete len:64 (+) comp8229_c0_seq1:3361-3552(+)